MSDAASCRWPDEPMDRLFGMAQLFSAQFPVSHAAQVLLAVGTARSVSAAGLLLLVAGELQHLRDAASGQVSLARLPLLMPPRGGPGSRSPAQRPALQWVALEALNASRGFLSTAVELLSSEPAPVVREVVSRLRPVLALVEELRLVYHRRVEAFVTAGKADGSTGVLRPDEPSGHWVQGFIHA